ncbi:hypothetical protein [Metabacillus iocasae]|uniref:Cell shape-determining protein MreC n=1 Tax=Priestia iocasae TaxID=2291674 RepID=A0ABS2QRC1_9BACI|nr:hypothetical protein [Metabacillus iocasae]MBM7701998.1 cell shape-determining protein MreC [Metabacillus iocasae]
MKMILEYKWFFFIGSELFFFICTAVFLLLRYWFQLYQLSIVPVILFLAGEVFLVGLGIYDYIEAGSFNLFQFIILLFVLYAMTSGKQSLKQLDHEIKQKVAKFKNQKSPLE